MLMWTYVTLRLSWQIARSWRGGGCKAPLAAVGMEEIG